MASKKLTDRQIIEKWLVDDGFSADEQTLSKVFEAVIKGIRDHPERSLRSAYLRVVLEHYLELMDGKFKHNGNEKA